MQPIQYVAPPEDPFKKALIGFQIGSAISDMQAKQQEAANAQALKEQYSKDMQEAFKLQTPEAFGQLAIKYPTQREAILAGGKLITEEQQKSAFNDVSKIYNSISTGNIDYARNFLDTKIKALENSGKDASDYLELKSQLEKDPKVAGATAAFIASSLNPERFLQIAKAPSEVSEAKSKAAQASSEEIIKTQQAKFAPEVVLAGLNLTKAQTSQANAAVKASIASANKTDAERKEIIAKSKDILSGIIPPEKRPELESKFRKEYSDQTKSYQEVKSAYGKILSSDNTGVGDISLIFSYMKMLDPGSVVREGEFATAQNSSGIPTNIQNIYNKSINGQRLTESQRSTFKAQAKNLYNSAKENEDTVRKGIERISEGYGLNKKNIFYTETEQAPSAMTSQFSVTTPDGKQFIFPNQKAADEFKKAIGVK